MTYLRSLFFNFLIVFFIVKVIPGITLVPFEGLANIGADLLFSIIVGFINSIIVIFMAIMNFKISILKIAISTFVISYLAFIVIGALNLEIKANLQGILLGGTLVWLISFFTNYLEFKHLMNKK